MARLSKTEIEAHRKGRAAAGATGSSRENPDASHQGPDTGRSAEREAQDHVLDHAARRDSWLAQLWRKVRQSTGRPSSPQP